MSVNDPLAGAVIVSCKNFSNGSSLMSLGTGRDLLLLPCFGDRDETVRDRAVLLQQLYVSDCIQKCVGVTEYGHTRLVFEHDSSETLYQRLSQTRPPGVPPFSAAELLVLMRGMQRSVALLHRRNVIHFQLHPKAFALTETGVKLTKLSKVEVLDTNFETMRKKEVKRLGSCFAAMITLQKFEELRDLQSRNQFELCCQSQLFTGEVRDIVGEALSSPFTLRTNPPLTVPRVLLPPPKFASRYSQESPRGSNGEESSSISSSTSGMSIQCASISVNSCLSCRNAMTFATPCKHNFCTKCFATHILSLTQVKPLKLFCMVCHSELPREFVFEHIVSEQAVVSALDEASIEEKAIKCPRCREYLGDDDGKAKNLTCMKCGLTFCSICMEGPHHFFACRRKRKKARCN